MKRLISALAFSAALVGAITMARLRASAEDPGTRWFSEVTVAEVGKTRVIAFEMTAAPAVDWQAKAEVGNAGVLEVSRAPAVLAGRTMGYVRVRGLSAGETTLSVGGATIKVRVVPARSPSEKKPVIVAPTDGAHVWRSFAVGVEMDGDVASEGATYLLRVKDKETIAAQRITGAVRGPTVRALFQVNTFYRDDGPLTLTPVVRKADGSEIEGEPVTVTVHHPAAKEVLQFEAEDTRDAKRPERFGTDPLAVGVDDLASGHQFVSMPGANPAACFALKVEKKGLYQMIATVKGTFAGGAWPTVGVIVDNGDQPETNSVLVDDDWHRIAIGVPFRLEAGDHFVTPWFMNDFYAAGPPADRNFFLDQVELIRVEKRSANASDDAGESMMMMMNMGGSKKDASRVLRVAFSENYDGLPATGTVEIGAACWWRQMNKAAAPRTTLLVNGVAVSSQRSATPKWWVDPARFQEGSNDLQVVATLDSGEEARTPVHRITWKSPWKDAASGKPFPYLRYTVRDEAWDAELKKVLSENNDCPEKMIGSFGSPGTATLKLPAKLSGTFLVWVEGRGDDFEGAPIAEVDLHVGDKTTRIGAPQIGGWWNPWLTGTVLLPEGPKTITVTFANDKYTQGKGDRNFFLQSLILVGAPSSPDGRGPRVRVVWPAEGSAIWRQDVVVVEATDDRGLAWVELEIDGKRTGVRADVPAKAGRIVLPFSTRGLAPGEHKIAVAAADMSGHDGKSKPRSVQVLAEAPAEPTAYEIAIGTLDRFAYGPDPAELAAILTLGPEAWLEDRLARPANDPGDANALAHACIVFTGQNGGYDVQGRDALQACATPNPVRHRFVRFVDNHFSTWIRKSQERAEWEERRGFTALGLAPFRDLLGFSSVSPCMLQYLDQGYSFARNLNENYAREVMELHTVGVHGGYTQADVTALATLLTGWSFSQEGDGMSPGYATKWTWRFDPALSDDRAQQFFGMAFPKTPPEGRLDRARLALELLAAHPRTAEFVCSKIAAQYTTYPADEALVADLSKVFLETDGDTKAILLALIRHPAFRRSLGTQRIAAPFDMSVRLSRACRLSLPWQVLDLCNRSGAGLYDRATPDGYPEDDPAWTSTNMMLQRWRFARDNSWALALTIPNTLRWTQVPADDAVRQSLLDIAAIRFTGRLLSDSSNAAALDVLKACKGNRDDLARMAASFVAQLPEAQTR